MTDLRLRDETALLPRIEESLLILACSIAIVAICIFILLDIVVGMFVSEDLPMTRLILWVLEGAKLE